MSAEDLMSYADYREWRRMQQNEDGSCDHDVKSRDHDVKSRDENNNRLKYERISCRAWTDLLLQLLKVTVGFSYFTVFLCTFKLCDQGSM